jgi:hypothetical protein
VIQGTALILLNMKSAEPKPFITTEKSGASPLLCRLGQGPKGPRGETFALFLRGVGGVRAEWQERQKTPARLQRKAATVRGSRWQLWQTKKG